MIDIFYPVLHFEVEVALWEALGRHPRTYSIHIADNACI